MSIRGTSNKLTHAAVCMALGVFMQLTPLANAAPALEKTEKAQNVIILIGDGMGPSHFYATHLYSERVLKHELNISRLMNTGFTAYVHNETADSVVTESAAAAGQIATGQPMVVRAISMTPDGKTPVPTIAELAKAKGKSVGLVTTSGITDATPAGFAAHVAKRSEEHIIAEQEIQANVDVLMGGRKKFFLPESEGGARKDGRNLLEEARTKGYTVVQTAAELQAAPQGKILGLFNKNDLAHEMDRGTTSEPSLTEMTEKALQTLSRNKKGFIAMIEGGRIDHAAHRNDAAGVIRDTLEFDSAVGVAMEFAKKNPRTLVLVTADHETAGMALIGHSKQSKEYVGMDFDAIRNVRASFEVILQKFGKNPSPETVRNVVRETMGIELTDEEAQTVANDTIRKLDPYNYTGEYLHSLGFVLRPYLRVGFGSQTHTASPIMLVAKGPGAARVHGLMRNTEIFTVMQNALGLQ